MSYSHQLDKRHERAKKYGAVRDFAGKRIKPDSPLQGYGYRASLAPVAALNCQFTLDALVTCRHLSFSFLTLHKLKQYSNVFSTETNMRSDARLASNFYDKEDIRLRADRYLWTNIKDEASPNSLGKVLWRLFEELPAGETKKIQFRSENHAMAFELKKENDPETGGSQYSVVFYDPNDTLAHRRWVLFSEAEVTTLTLNQFLSKKSQNFYFPTIQSGVLMVYDHPESVSPKKPEGARVMEVEGSESPDLHFLLYLGMVNQAKVRMISILDSSLSSAEKIEQLTASGDRDPLPALYWAMTGNQAETVRMYLREILHSNLDLESKKKLLSAEDRDKTRALYTAFYYGNTETIRAYLGEILASDLPPDDQQDLISTLSSKEGYSGLAAAIQNRHFATVDAYGEAVLNSALAPRVKRELLLANLAMGEDFLNFYLSEGSLETREKYISAFMGQQNLLDGLLSTNTSSSRIVIPWLANYQNLVVEMLEKLLESGNRRQEVRQCLAEILEESPAKPSPGHRLFRAGPDVGALPRLEQLAQEYFGADWRSNLAAEEKRSAPTLVFHTHRSSPEKTRPEPEVH